MLRSAQVFFMLALIAASFGGLAYAVVSTSPDDLVHRVALFGALFAAASSTAMLVAYVLSFRMYVFRRFHGDMARSAMQAIPIGMAVAVAAWLQSMRALSVVSGVILLLILTVAEYVTLPARR